MKIAFRDITVTARRYERSEATRLEGAGDRSPETHLVGPGGPARWAGGSTTAWVWARSRAQENFGSLHAISCNVGSFVG